MNLYEKNLIPEQTVSQILYKDGLVSESDISGQSASAIVAEGATSRGQVLVNPRIIGGILEGGSFRTANSGARVEMFPSNNPNTGILVYDDASSVVFKIIQGNLVKQANV